MTQKNTENTSLRESKRRTRLLIEVRLGERRGKSQLQGVKLETNADCSPPISKEGRDSPRKKGKREKEEEEEGIVPGSRRT